MCETASIFFFNIAVESYLIGSYKIHMTEELIIQSEEVEEKQYPYVSLHNHTTFSIFQSLTKPADLFERAKQLGQKAIAVTDKNSCAGLWDSLRESKKTGIKLIAGLEISFVDDVSNKESKLRNIVLIAKNAKGYENLLKVSKLGFDNFIMARKSVTPRVDWSILEQNKEGLLCITGDTSGIISRLLNDKKFDEAEKTAQRLKDIFGDDLALELQPNALKRTLGNFNEPADQAFTNRQLKKLGEKLNIRLIAATNSYYTNPEQYKAHDVWLAVGSGQPVKSGNRLSFNVNDFYIKSGEEVHKFFARTYGEEFATKLLEDTVKFAKKCEKPEWIDLKFSNPSGKELPVFPVKDQEDYAEFKKWLIKQKNQTLEEDVQYLRYKCVSNYKTMIADNAKYKEVADIYKKRIYEELDVLENQGFSGYMLIVGDFLEWARKNGVSVGPGRGCLLGDTKVLTKNGFTNLNEINIGDSVYTESGSLNKVIDKFEYNIDENELLLNIKTNFSFKNLVMTKDHKVLAVKSSIIKENFKLRIKNKDNIHKKYKYIDIVPEWIIADKLCVGDCIYTKFPKRKNIFIPEKIDLSKFIDYKRGNVILTDDKINYSGSGGVYSINRYIVFDYETLYFIGRFVGDGSLSSKKSTISISFNSNDIYGMDRISNWIEDFGLHVQKAYAKKNKCVHVRFTNKILHNFFKSIFYNYEHSSETKHFPDFFKTLPKDHLISFLKGYSAADGCINKKDDTEMIVTVSSNLAMQLKEALLYINIPSAVRIKNPYVRIFKSGPSNCQKCYTVTFKGLNTKVNNEVIKNGGYISKIREIGEIKANKVYDISVNKNSSYLTTNGIVHNSAGGSLVAYLLGIHIADPIKYNLFFQRFHSKFKVNSPPDIDSDLSTANRYLVEEYLIQKYGISHVAHISNYNTMTPKPYVKAIARTFMYGGDRSEAVKVGVALADTIPAEAKTVSHMFDYSPLLNEYSKKYKELKEYAEAFGKNPIAVATHAAAIIISKRELFGLIPVRRDKDKQLSLEYEKERAEENGMVKMDLLGLTTLDIIDNTYKLIKQCGKTVPYEKFDYETYDKKSYDLISDGNTTFIFQLGTSGGTIELCKKYQPKSIEDLAIITTLARPAAKELRENFFKVKNGEREISYFHPLLERAFSKTLGFPLYDESLLILAEDVAKWDLNEADKLRKLTKEKGKNPAKAKKWKEEFILNAFERNNINQEIAEKIWVDIIEPFGKYSFCKSHAVLYSMISYHTAYLKAHYPMEFLVANLMQEVNSGAKIAKDNISRLKEEIRKKAVKIVPPDINTSGPTYTIINESTLATGLNALKYMGQDAVPEILLKRPFKSFEDFLSRTDSSKVKAPAIQALAASGALSDFNMPRKQMFLYAADYKKKLQIWLKKKPEKRGEFSYPWPEIGEWTIPEINALEQYYIGEGLTGSKFEVYKGFFTKNHHNFSKFTEMLPPPPESMSEADRKSHQIKVNYVQGIVKSVFEFKIKKEKSKLFGQTMAKVTIEDPYGNQLGVTFFPEKWEYLKERIKDRNSKLKFEIGMGLSLIGNLQWWDGNISLIFDELQEACFPPQLPPDLKAKKTETVKKAKLNEVVDENMDRVELLEEIEDELAENGYADLDDEDEEEIVEW